MAASESEHGTAAPAAQQQQNNVEKHNKIKIKCFVEESILKTNFDEKIIFRLELQGLVFGIDHFLFRDLININSKNIEMFIKFRQQQ